MLIPGARWLLLLSVAALGCGGDGHPAPMPMALLGNYAVQVEANGMVDKNILMTVSAAANDRVLLTFTAGISLVRCDVYGSTMIHLPRQTLHVAHASGTADGQATGDGTIDAGGSVDLTIHLSTIGISPPDGGDPSGVVDYHVTGARQ